MSPDGSIAAAAPFIAGLHACVARYPGPSQAVPLPLQTVPCRLRADERRCGGVPAAPEHIPARPVRNSIRCSLQRVDPDVIPAPRIASRDVRIVSATVGIVSTSVRPASFAD